jgi:lysophospholipase L1-like esterase
MNLNLLQAIFVVFGTALLPFFPFLYLQGQRVRKKIGVLPGASGDTRGKVGDGAESVKLLVIGESTVAGLGAKTHETALSGQFSFFLSQALGRSVEWLAIGKNGVTARRTIDELVPLIPAGEKFDFVLLGVGGNDVLKVSSPKKWRKDMLELISIMRSRYPECGIFMTNAPAVHLSPVLPHPIKGLLGGLSKMHELNTKEFTRDLEKVYYFHRPTEVPHDFWADGIHPSEAGYRLWSERMVRFFTENYSWPYTKPESPDSNDSSRNTPSG